MASEIPGDAADFAARLADGLPEIFDSMTADPIVSYWAYGGNLPNPVITVGSPHGGPIYRVTVTRLTGLDEASAQRGLGQTYDDEIADQYDESPEEFRSHLGEGHLYDGYQPYPGSAAWPHRRSHEKWRYEQMEESGLIKSPTSGEGVQWVGEE